MCIILGQAKGLAFPHKVGLNMKYSQLSQARMNDLHSLIKQCLTRRYSQLIDHTFVLLFIRQNIQK